jgi:class 3 adenylate cyclase
MGVRVDGIHFRRRWYDVGSPRDHRKLNQRELAARFEANDEFRHPIEGVIMFADIIGSVSMAEFLDLEDYDDFLAEYQTLAKEAIERNLDRFHIRESEDEAFVEYSIRGDEALLILYTSEPERDAKVALATAIALKREWFLSGFNRSRKGRAFYDVGIGIHYGTVMLRRHVSTVGTKRVFNAEGYAISLAKRIEHHSREGRLSRIMLSKSFVALAELEQVHTIQVSKAVAAKLAGIYGAATVHELEVHGDIEDPLEVPGAEPQHLEYYKAVLENSQHDLWLLLMIARYYYDEEDYTTAQRYYTDAIKRFPEFAAGYMFLGRSLYRQHRFDEAKIQLQAALKRNPTSLRIKSFLAVTLRRLGEHEGAILLHKEAINAPAPTAYDHNAYAYTLAEMVTQEHPVDQARLIDEADHHLAVARRRPEAANECLDYILDHTAGMIQLARGNYLESIRHFRKVIEAIQNNDAFHRLKREDRGCEASFHLGQALAYVEQWEPAIQALERSVRIDQRDGHHTPYWFMEAGKALEVSRKHLPHGQPAGIAVMPFRRP